MVRTFSAVAQDIVENRFRALCDGVGGSYGAQIDLEYLRESPAVVNSDAPVQHVVRAVQAVAPDGLNTTPVVTMAAEDVSFFLNAVPGYSHFHPPISAFESFQWWYPARILSQPNDVICVWSKAAAWQVFLLCGVWKAWRARAVASYGAV